MNIKYDKTEDGYKAWLMVGEDRIHVADITRGFWEMPRRNRWELGVVGDAKSAKIYEDTLSDIKYELEHRLGSIIIKALQSKLESV